MVKSKLILAAGILKDIRFASADDADLYLYKLDHSRITYQVLDSCRCDDGSVILRVVQRYNDCELIQVYH